MKTLIAFILTLILGQYVFSQDKTSDEIKKAQNLVMQGQKEEASAILLKIMANEPDNKQAVQFWLIANMKRSPTGEMDAVKQLDSLAAIYPKNTGIIFFKNFIYAEYGKNEEALAGFDQLIKLQPDSAVNYIGKGQVLSAMSRHEESCAAFEKSTSLDPKRFDVWGMQAAEQAKLKRFEEAVTSINKGIELAPDYAGNIYNRACIYSLKGDKTKALEDLKTAVGKMPQLKQHARSDEDFKILWEDEEFKKITE